MISMITEHVACVNECMFLNLVSSFLGLLHLTVYSPYYIVIKNAIYANFEGCSTTVQSIIGSRII